MPLTRSRLLGFIGIDATSGSVIYGKAGGDGLEQDNTNFSWDRTNKALSIGSVGVTTTSQQFGGGSTAPVSAAGTGRLRYNQVANQFEVSYNGAAYVAIGIAGAGNTLDQAYDAGGPGLGRSIDAANGAVTIGSTVADNNNLLELTKNPAGAQSGNALDITMGVTTTGDAIYVTHGGSGYVMRSPSANVVRLGTATGAPSFGYATVNVEDDAGDTAWMQAYSGDSGVEAIMWAAAIATGSRAYYGTLSTHQVEIDSWSIAMVVFDGDSTPAASTETPMWSFDYNDGGADTRTWAAGALALQRDFLIEPNTIAFGAASVVADAVVFEVSGPTKIGAFATITNNWTARIGPDQDAPIALGRMRLDGRVADRVVMSHYDNTTATNYFLKASQTERLDLNAGAAFGINFNIANVEGVRYDGSFFRPSFEGIDLGASAASSHWQIVYANQISLSDATNDISTIEMTDGDTAAVSNANAGRFRYNVATQTMQLSNNTGAYADIASTGSLTLTIGDPIASGTGGSILWEDGANTLAESLVMTFDGVDSFQMGNLYWEGGVDLDDPEIVSAVQFYLNAFHGTASTNAERILYQFQPDTFGTFRFPGGLGTSFAREATVVMSSVNLTAIAPTLTVADTYTLYVGDGPGGGTNVNVTNRWAAGFAGNVHLSNASGPALLNAASSGTQPTFITNRSDTTTGWGGVAGSISFISSSTERARFTGATLLWPTSGTIRAGTALTVRAATGISFQPDDTTDFAMDADIFRANDASGPGFLNEAPTINNPVVVYNRTDLTTGHASSAAGQIDVVLSGNQAGTWDMSGATGVTLSVGSSDVYATGTSQLELKTDVRTASIGLINSNGVVLVTPANSSATVYFGASGIPYQFSNQTFTFTQSNLTSLPATYGVIWTTGTHTGFTASTEATAVNFNLSSTKTWATGALATQREMRIQAPTYAFATGSTLSDAVLLDLNGAPAAGANATITNSTALRVAGTTTLASAAGVTAAAIEIPDYTVTLTGTTELTTFPSITGLRIGTVTITDASAVTVDIAASAYIEGPPVAAGSVTLPFAYSLWVDAGTSRFDDSVAVLREVKTAESISPALQVTEAAHLDVPTGSEPVSVYFDLSATINFDNGGGSTAAVRAIRMLAPTYTADAAYTIDDSATLYVNAAPTASTNVTITRPWAVWVDAGVTRLDDGIVMIERAAAPITATATQGLLWIKNTTPSSFVFTDDNAISTTLGRLPPSVANAATYNMVNGDQLISVTRTATGTCQVNLVAAATVGSGYVLVIVDTGGGAGTFNITINPDSGAGELISGAATATISANYNALSIWCDGSDWFIF